jgi:hypothetical protein
MPTDPKKDADKGIEDALSAFNADQILEDPDALDPKDEHDEGEAATPDSPNPI